MILMILFGLKFTVLSVVISSIDFSLLTLFTSLLGHAIATGLAVVGGAIIGKSINERVVTITSGVLFIIFGITSMCGIF